MPRWLAKAGAACFGCFSPVRRPADDKAAKVATPSVAAKPKGLAAAAADFEAPPMHVVVPRTAWSAAAAAAAAQTASQGEAPSSQAPGVTEMDDTIGANFPPTATSAEPEVAPPRTQPTADNPCRALIPYSVPVHQRQCEQNTNTSSGGRDRGIITIKLLIDVSAFHRAEVIPIAALVRVAVLPRLAADATAATSGAEPRPPPPGRESSMAPATQGMTSDVSTGRDAASTGAPYNQCTTMIVYPVRVMMTLQAHIQMSVVCRGTNPRCCISIAP